MLERRKSAAMCAGLLTAIDLARTSKEIAQVVMQGREKLPILFHPELSVMGEIYRYVHNRDVSINQPANVHNLRSVRHYCFVWATNFSCIYVARGNVGGWQDELLKFHINFFSNG